MESQTEDPREAALEAIRRDVQAAGRMHSTVDQAQRDLLAAQAHATIELVEAVRDFTAIVALAVAPKYQEPPIVDESAAESGDGGPGWDDAPARLTFADFAPRLAVGDDVVTDSGNLLVTSAGTTEGSAWIEVHDGKKAKRVFVDAVPPKLAARVVLSVEGDGGSDE